MTANHRRLGDDQRIWFAFADARDHWWQRLLRPGFRHCFAALRDRGGWTVVEPLSGRLIVARLDVPAGFDLPGFYARAGLTVLGPFQPEGPARPRAPLRPGCAALCAALLGDAAPKIWTPQGLFHALNEHPRGRKKTLTGGPGLF
ncbi:MAG: hypothetical protein K2X11_08440 [Acetobacteraceae bacterium]|nr:hypothetical protein [Acetobacteraceae bacterium]